MSDSLTLYSTLMKFLWQNDIYIHDIRCLATFGWAMVGLIQSQKIHLSQWQVHRVGRANAASKQRQLSRWLHNPKINPSLVYYYPIKAVLRAWTGQTLYLALFRIRLKNSVWIQRANKAPTKVGRLMPAKGQACFFHTVRMTQQAFGPVHLALAYVQTPHGYQQWAIVSDEPTELATLDEYAGRFDLEALFCSRNQIYA